VGRGGGGGGGGGVFSPPSPLAVLRDKTIKLTEKFNVDVFIIMGIAEEHNCEHLAY